MAWVNLFYIVDFDGEGNGAYYSTNSTIENDILMDDDGDEEYDDVDQMMNVATFQRNLEDQQKNLI